MGMFDTVHFTCPHCGEVTSLQTKLGKCELEDYYAYPDGSNLTPQLMTAIAEQQKSYHMGHKTPGVLHPGPVTCSNDNCQKKFRLVLINTPMAVLQPVDRDDDD